MPETRDVAITATAAFGTFGIAANFMETPFLNAATKVMAAIEQSTAVSNSLTRFLNAKLKARRKPPGTHESQAETCDDLLAL